MFNIKILSSILINVGTPRIAKPSKEDIPIVFSTLSLSGMLLSYSTKYKK
ncbi:MAG: hypothetical protein VB015_00525 [Erysipelotrichaceae bacterium]|nr:hypothetical protein [Erysipelotrichaceae bacterium]